MNEMEVERVHTLCCASLGWKSEKVEKQKNM